ncbi:MAG: aminodeoxychorismate/anthranilate synthase component II [Bacteroidales bacterium]|nr:aminodeoxychorismate/anthranilate synthase component II [Bacteroidales bacterium]
MLEIIQAFCVLLYSSGKMLNTIAAKVLILDNNDSFTWNLAELVRMSGLAEVIVRPTRSLDVIDLSEVNGVKLSPGPGLPSDFPEMRRLILEQRGIPVLGICLGHQAIAEAFGARLKPLDAVRHGKARKLDILNHSGIFSGLPQGSSVGLYHSWVVSDDELPEVFSITARDEDGVIMGLKHNHLPLEGLQFHPESVISMDGVQMMHNWLSEMKSLSQAEHSVVTSDGKSEPK